MGSGGLYCVDANNIILAKNDKKVFHGTCQDTFHAPSLLQVLAILHLLRSLPMYQGKQRMTVLRTQAPVVNPDPCSWLSPWPALTVETMWKMNHQVHHLCLRVSLYDSAKQPQNWDDFLTSLYIYVSLLLHLLMLICREYILLLLQIQFQKYNDIFLSPFLTAPSFISFSLLIFYASTLVVYNHRLKAIFNKKP